MPSAFGFSTGAALLLGSLAFAPFQCASERDPDYATEETPGEALYQLAERMRSEGDEAARKKTLRFLIERYPSSRFARMAREDLAAADEP